MVKECSKQGQKETACRILNGNSDGKRSLGKPRGRREDTIEMDI
jgi:hypothetical protein